MSGQCKLITSACWSMEISSCDVLLEFSPITFMPIASAVFARRLPITATRCTSNKEVVKGKLGEGRGKQGNHTCQAPVITARRAAEVRQVTHIGTKAYIGTVCR